MNLIKNKKFILFITIIVLIIASITAAFAYNNDFYISSYKQMYNLDNANIHREIEIKDFAGNAYILLEIDPIGYAIFEKTTGNIIEASSSSVSPYYNIDGELVYGGMKNYYHKSTKQTRSNELSYKNCLTDEMLNSDEKEFLTLENQKLNENIINDSTKQIETRAVTKSYYVPYADFFSRMENCGYTSVNINGEEKGICGYIALGMLLTYRHYANNNENWISEDQYTWDDAAPYPYPKENLPLELYGIAKSLGKSNSSISTDLKDVMNKFKNRLNFDIKHISFWTPFFSQLTINENLQKGNPVILFGSMPLDINNQSGEKGAHAVTCYGYEERSINNKKQKFNIVHYGWNSGSRNYANVSISTSVILGSIYSVVKK